MSQKRLLVHFVAWMLVVGLLTVVTPVAFAVAPVQDQEGSSAVQTRTTTLLGAWFAQVWEKLVIWNPYPSDPGAGQQGGNNSEGGDGSGDVGPAVDPNP